MATTPSEERIYGDLTDFTDVFKTATLGSDIAGHAITQIETIEANYPDVCARFAGDLAIKAQAQGLSDTTVS